MANFNTYDLREIQADPQGVNSLAGGLMPEMAEAFGFELPVRPDEQTLKRFITEVAPARYLQDNIGLVQRRLDTYDEPVTIAADWVERSGVLLPMSRSFATPEALPEQSITDVAFMGGAARHMLRRGQTAEQYLDGKKGATLVVAAGAREMDVAEHELVPFYMDTHDGAAPTEADFAERFVMPRFAGNLALMGKDGAERSYMIRVASKAGRDVAAALAAKELEINGMAPTLIIGNAPSTIESVAQYRRARGDGFDRGDRLGQDVFVLSDGIAVARQGEGPATHQNPYTALGQIARNAMYLQLASQSL